MNVVKENIAIIQRFSFISTLNQDYNLSVLFSLDAKQDKINLQHTLLPPNLSVSLRVSYGKQICHKSQQGTL